jgi:hypothetical protein
MTSVGMAPGLIQQKSYSYMDFINSPPCVKAREIQWFARFS